MKIQIGNGRDVILKRNKETGEWSGEGHGYRFRVVQIWGRESGWGTQWKCRVYLGKGAIIASYRAHTLKIAVQNATHAADKALAERNQSKDAACPT